MLLTVMTLFGSEYAVEAYGGIDKLPNKLRMVYNILHENRIPYAIFVLISGSLMQGLMLCSEAFEIYVNDNLEWSKL